MNWLFSNLGTIIVTIIVFAVVGLIVLFRIRAKKKGKSSCGCGCSNCPMNGKCH